EIPGAREHTQQFGQSETVAVDAGTLSQGVFPVTLRDGIGGRGQLGYSARKEMYRMTRSSLARRLSIVGALVVLGCGGVSTVPDGGGGKGGGAAGAGGRGGTTGAAGQGGTGGTGGTGGSAGT